VNIAKSKLNTTSSTTAIVVMTKAPVAGQAKTRLIPALGPEGAAQLAQRMLNATVRTALESQLGPVMLSAAPSPTHPAFSSWASEGIVKVIDQGEGDLGQRMSRALQTALSVAPSALLIGTDAPDLDIERLEQAAKALETNDLAFVPTHDGGYVLVGIRLAAAAKLPKLFDRMAWSTPEVMADTRERAAQLGLKLFETQRLHDIDTPQDLTHLPQSWQIGDDSLR
jgi:uncharacterized protein